MYDGDILFVKHTITPSTPIFYPVAALANISSTLFFHPLIVVRTRVIIQKNKTVYAGMINGLSTMISREGVSSLYNGYATRSVQVLPGIIYIWTYESLRSHLSEYSVSPGWRSFVAAGASAVVQRTLSLPSDVVSQHLMLITNKDPIAGQLSVMTLDKFQLQTSKSRFKAVCGAIYANYGILGFYRGFLLQILSSSPSNACWWGIYNVCCDHLFSLKDSNISLPRYSVVFVAGSVASVTVSCIFNCVDVTRIRMQLNNTSIKETVVRLWQEEKWRFFAKGLSSKIVSSWGSNTYCIMIYEYLKLYYRQKSIRTMI